MNDLRLIVTIFIREKLKIKVCFQHASLFYEAGLALIIAHLEAIKK